MIPTAFGAIGPSFFFQNYWWLRSPSTAWGDYVWLVYPDGDVDSGYSYVTRSYGVLFPDIRYTSFWWVDISGTLDSYLHNDVSYSYRNFSPYTAGISIWNIYPDGTIIGNHDGYFYSYGNLM